jgi:hypothetical protein
MLESNSGGEFSFKNFEAWENLLFYYFAMPLFYCAVGGTVAGKYIYGAYCTEDYGSKLIFIL